MKTTIRIGGDEFGEIYHAAAWVSAADDHHVEIEGNESERSKWMAFLDDIRKDSAHILKKSKASDPGVTADWFAEHKFDNMPKTVEDKWRPLLEDHERIKKVADKLGRFEADKEMPSCLLWVRHRKYKPERNLTSLACEQLKSILMEAGVRPIMVGAKPPYEVSDEPNLIEFYAEEDIYKNDPLMQLVFLNQLCTKACMKFQIGMKSGAMDGLAFASQLPTYYITSQATNGRMDKVETAFPAFRKLLVAYDRKFMAFSPEEMERVFAAIS